MKNKTKTLSLTAIAAMLLASASCTQQNEKIATGPFQPNWESLENWECPEWFKDAKFGLWAHWGPQCEAESGDWYARHMYYEGHWQNKAHLSKYGNPNDFGLMDLCNEWKAEKWNPDELVALYKSVGARYFFTLGQHHDNFDLWDSKYQEWNSVNVGPKKDIIKGWADACKKYGLPLGISMHASHTWTWLEKSQDYEGNLTKEDGYKPNPDGTDKWWKGLDPQELYAQRHPHSEGWEKEGSIHSQWAWANGASLPSEEYKMKFQNRVLECINNYDPQVLYFDDTVLPFYGCDDQIGLNILAHYYNTSIARNEGKMQAVAMGKVLEDWHKNSMMWDVERGTPDKIQEEYWQTCTCIGEWHYNEDVYRRNRYKNAKQVVNMLVDVVSKNGNLLLSIPVKGDGSIDEKEMEILMQIKAWMDINGNSIYGTRPWKTFGEGPLADSSNPIHAQGFNEKDNYSSKDIRFAQRNDTVFTTILRWPEERTVTIKSFGITSPYYSGNVKSVELLGYGAVDFSNEMEGLVVTLPKENTNDIAPVFAISFAQDNVNKDLVQEVQNHYKSQIKTLKPLAGNNTGKITPDALTEFENLLSELQMTNSSDIQTLNNGYAKLISEGFVGGEKPESSDFQDITESMLTEKKNFSRKRTENIRFDTPANWTVENFLIPNGKDGAKNGIDRYTGYNCLMLGVWNDRHQSKSGNLKNARIYKRIHLEAGEYYFGATYNTVNSLNSAYIFAAESLLPTNNIEEKSIACLNIGKKAKEGKDNMSGIRFTVNSPKTVFIGFQANIAEGSQTQEFRVDEVCLLKKKN